MHSPPAAARTTGNKGLCDARDAALALLLQRSHLAGERVELSSPVSGKKAWSCSSASDPKELFVSHDPKCRTFTVTTKYALANEVQQTEQIVHHSQKQPPRVDNVVDTVTTTTDALQQPCAPALHELEDLMNELYEVCDRAQEEELSLREAEYTQTLFQAVVTALAQVALMQVSESKQPHEVPLGEIRVWLLEMAVRPTALSRQLAFTLFLNLSVATMTVLIVGSAAKSDRHKAEALQSCLFQLLLEMLSKAVVVANSTGSHQTNAEKQQHTKGNSIVWMKQAVGCLLFFTKQNDRYRSDRLCALDPMVLRYVVREISKQEGRYSDVADEKLIELLVFSMYAHAAAETKSGYCSQQRLPLSLAIVDRFCGLDMLLYHLYNTNLLRVQRLLLMALFDLTFDQIRRSSSSFVNDQGSISGYEELLIQFLHWDIASYLTSIPILFTSSSLPRLVAKLHASLPASSLSEKQMQAFFHQFRLLVQVDEYFTHSNSLANVIKMIDSHEHNRPANTLIAKMSQLLQSSRIEENFHGERWLAELLTYGIENSATPASESILQPNEDVSTAVGNSSPNPTREQENTSSSFDVDSDIRTAARCKFWELVSASSPPAARNSFARVLCLFIKRKIRPKMNLSVLSSLVREINICLDILMHHQEDNPNVLSTVMLLIIDLCKREVSYVDKQQQLYDRKRSEKRKANHMQQLASSSTDSLPSRLLEGQIALDMTILQQFKAEFLLHVLSVLHLAAHPLQTCQLFCCGSAASFVGDLTACTALILTEILQHQQTFDRIGGVTALTPFLESCDTRVAVLMAKLITQKVKQLDVDKYYAVLREIHANAVEDDDAAPLANSYLHARTLQVKYNLITS